MDLLKPTKPGSNLKRGKVRESHMEQLTLDPPPESSDEAIKSAFKEIVYPENPSQQIKGVEKMLDAALKCDENARVCANLLILSLLQLQFKCQLRTKISKFVSSIGNRYPDTYEECVLEVLRRALSDNENPLRIMQAMNLLVEDGPSVFSRLERDTAIDPTESENGRRIERSLPSKIHPYIRQGMLKCIDQLWGKQKEALSSIEATHALQHTQLLVKNSTAYLQLYSDENRHESSELKKLLDQLLLVIEHSSCLLDLRINCGQLIAVIHSLCSEDGMNHLVNDVIDDDGRYSNLSPLAQLAIINGILCVSSGIDLYRASSNESYLGIRVLEAILSPRFQSNDGSMALSTIRMVQHWTLRTLEATKSSEVPDDLEVTLHPNSPLMSRFLDYLWLSWDHFLDSVKHAAKDSFQNLIKIHLEVCLEECKSHYTELCRAMLVQPLSRKYKMSAVSSLVPVVGSRTLLTHEPQLPHLLLSLMKDCSMASHAAELLEALFTVHMREVSHSEWQDVWLGVFLDSFCEEMQTFGYELLFKKMLLTCPESLDVVIATLSECAEQAESDKLCLLIMCTKIGRQSAYFQRKCQETNSGNMEMWKAMLPYKTISLCLKYSQESVQMAAFSLLCESPKSTEKPEKGEMDLILDYLCYNITNQSPSYKQHIVKNTKKLLLRIKESVRILVKSKNERESVVESMSELRDFCKKLFMLMLQNLHIGANIARRGLSLLILELFHDILYQDCHVHLALDELSCNQVYRDTLLYVLDDSYEANKVIALKLLLVIPQDKIEMQEETKVKCLLEAACFLSSSCRPPDTITASYILKFLLHDPMATNILLNRLSDSEQSQDSYQVFFRFLLTSLRNELKVAQISLLKAAASGPMYGLLLCLRILLSDIPKHQFEKNHNIWKVMVLEVLDICYRISDLVASVVRNSSPEGHLPMDLNPESLANLKAVLKVSLGNQQCEDDVPISSDSKPDELVKAQAVSAQMLLLCAWRSVKEISLIMGDIIQKYPLPPDKLSVLSESEVKNIGQYFLKQLSETKHRGAFEQSYLGFSRICERLWQCNKERLCSLPEEWLAEVLHTIQNDDDDRLCATRRSAGVPFIIQAILSSEPSVRGAVCLKNTMDTLLQLAEDQHEELSDAKIHAFNILRSLYRDTRLGDLIVPYAPRGVKAAINGYKSDSWAVRNSASLLFASLMTRMFGVKKTHDDLSRKNAMSALVFFRRYPELYEFISGELDEGAIGVKEGKLVPSLFPILLLLARLSPSPIEGRSSTLSLAAFTPSVILCTSSSVFQLRGLASHALIPLVTPDSVASVVGELCNAATLANQNRLHGSLLCLLKLFRCFNDVIENDTSNSIVSDITKIYWAATEANSCFVTRACALELFALLIGNHVTLGEFPVLSVINSSAYNIVTLENSSIAHDPWATICKKEAAHYCLQFVRNNDSRVSELLGLFLRNEDYEVRLLCLEYMATLEDLPASIFWELIDRVQGQEEHNECLIQGFYILNKFAARGDNVDLCNELEKITKLLDRILRKANEETCMELLTELLCFSSSIVTNLLPKCSAGQFESSLSQWLELLIGLAGSENDLDVRIEVAKSISSILPYFTTHRQILGKSTPNVFEALVMLLQDDSILVRDVVASAIGKHMDHEELQRDCHSARVLEIVCDIIGRDGTPESLSLLVKLALKENLPEGFGLAQDDDRVFDKGEMNAYREDRTITKAAVRALSNALDCLTSKTSLISFTRHEIIPYLCLESKEDNEQLSIENLLKLLADDVCYINDYVSLETKAIYCVKNIEIWLARLYSRAALWKTLKTHVGFESDVLLPVVTNLNRSSIKGLFLTEIIDLLS